MSTAGRSVLEVKNVGVQFGGLRACDEITFDITEGELFALIGPNGAGKTTLVNAITGVYAPVPGSSITYHDRKGQAHNLLGPKPFRIVRYGLARTFQNLGLFPSLSVLENLMLGRYIHGRSGVIASGLRLPRVVREEVRQREVVERVISLLEIERYRDEAVGSLPYGIQKRIELGRVLAMEPHLLMLDEPMAGMTVEEKKDMIRFIFDARAELDLTILMIEHDMGVVMSIADRVMVLEFGRQIALGTPDEVQKDERVIEAYLGRG